MLKFISTNFPLHTVKFKLRLCVGSFVIRRAELASIEEVNEVVQEVIQLSTVPFSPLIFVLSVLKHDPYRSMMELRKTSYIIIEYPPP